MFTNKVIFLPEVSDGETQAWDLFVKKYCSIHEHKFYLGKQSDEVPWSVRWQLKSIYEFVYFLCRIIYVSLLLYMT